MVATLEIPSTCNQSLAAMCPDPNRLAYGYLAYFLESKYEEIRGLVGDGLRDGLNLEHVKSFAIPLPPISEQQDIDRFLQAVDSRINGFIRSKRRLIELLNEQKQAIIHHAVTRGLDPDVPLKPSGVDWLGDIPTHWIVTKIGRYARVFNGSTPSRSEPKYWQSGTIPWLSSTRVNDGVVTRPTELITEEAFRKTNLSMVPKGSVIVGLVGQGRTRGMSALLGIDAAISQNLAANVPFPGLNGVFLQLVLGGFYEDLRDFGRGGNQDALNCNIVSSFLIAIPPINEQIQIVEKLSKRSIELDKSKHILQSEIELIREYRTRLIADVVTGKLDVREAAAELAQTSNEEFDTLLESDSLLGDDSDEPDEDMDGAEEMTADAAD